MHCSKLTSTLKNHRTNICLTSLVAGLLLSACGTTDKMLQENSLAASPSVVDPVSDSTTSDTQSEIDKNVAKAAALLGAHQDRVAAVDTEDEPAPLNITLTTWRAERGHVDSQLALGLAYASGTPRVEKDLSEAKHWFELAALNSNDQAQYQLGKMFYTGLGATQDYFNAREWWQESAEQGNLEAQQRLGYLYSEGLGVERDFELAKLWYSKAANQGHAEAQTLLGSLYHEGDRIPTDYNEAFKWYKLAAEQGHPHAQYTLATLYHDGLGTEVDYVQCAAWIDVALENGAYDEYDAGDNCRQQLDDLSNRTATHLADVWKKRYLSAEL